MLHNVLKEDRTTRVLILIFIILAAGILLAGYLSYANYAAHYRNDVERQLSAIAEMKVADIANWRRERLGDANVFLRNDVFSRLVSRYLEAPGDRKVSRALRSWLGKYQNYHQYDRIMLLDTRFIKRMIIPDKPDRANSFVSHSSSRILKSGKIAFEDLYWNEQNQNIYLKILVPIYEENGSSRMIAVLAFRIDPNIYLYPYIQNWPTVSKTAETLLIRREGNEVVFLNELRFQKNTALKLRFSLERLELPAVKAVLGQQGIVEGRDYRDEPVIAAVRAISDSPWYLSARMDISEMNAPLIERLMLVIALVAALLIGAGVSVGLVWRQERLRFYRERGEAAEALRASGEIYRRLVETANEAIYVAQDGMLKFVNRMTVEITGYSEQELTSTPFSAFIHPDDRDMAVGRHIRRIKGEAVPDRNQCRIIARGGCIKWAEISGVLIDWEGKPATLNVLTDITERKQADEALRQAEEKYRSIFENAVEGIFQTTPEGYYISANPSLARMFGYDSREEMMSSVTDIGRQRYINPEQRKEHLRLVNEKGVVEGFEAPMYRKNGSIVWVSINTRVVRDDAGNPLYYEGYATDITESKRAKDVLRESEKRYRMLVDNTDTGFVVIDDKGIVITANEPYQRIAGVKGIEDLIGHSVIEWTAPDEHENNAKAVALCARQGFIKDFETVYQHGDGRKVHIIINATRQESPEGGMHIVSFCRDITERRHAEEAMRESEENYRRSLDDSPLGVRIVTLEGETIYANRAILDIYGYDSIEELRTTPVKQRYTPESYAQFQTRKEKRRRGDVDPSEYEISIVRKSGEVRHLHVFRKITFWDGEKQFQVIYRDITDHKRMEEALRESEKLYRSLFDNMLNGLAYCQMHYDDNGRPWDFTYLSVNSAFEKLTGLRNVAGKKVTEVIPGIKEANPELLETYGRVALTGKPERFEDYFETLKVWLFISVYSPAKGYFVAIFDNITERKQAEETLHLSEENFRRSLEDSPLGVRIVNIEGETLYANRAILDIYGYDHIEELKDTPVEKRYTPESYAAYKIRMEKRKRGDDVSSEYEISIIRKKGEVRNLHVFRKDVLWNGEQQFQAIYQDITERKRAEEALRESEEKYRNVFETIVEGIYRTTPEGRFVIINRAFAAICGYASPEEMMKKVIDIPNQLYANPEDRLRFQKRIAVEGKVKCFEVQFKHPAKGLIWISINSKIIRDEEGNIRYYDGTIEDITERKQVEEDLKRSSQQLRALAERLQQIREESQIMIAQEIHDELGGGLTGLKMDLSWLLQEIEDEKAGKESHSLMNRIHTASRSINRLIRTVRDIATKLRPSVLDDLGLIAALEWECEEFAKRAGIQCEFVSAFEYVNLDEKIATAIFRIFQEALTNVARHSGASKVTVLFREESGCLYLGITDNGRGITEDEIVGMKSLGILGMRERALVFGGELLISGEPDSGTNVILKIPQQQEETP